MVYFGVFRFVFFNAKNSEFYQLVSKTEYNPTMMIIVHYDDNNDVLICKRGVQNVAGLP